MTVYALTEDLVFPPPEHAEVDGLLAVGGDLRPERLVLAYSNGIFPWYNEGLPILWHSPDPRMVLTPSRLHVGRTLRKAIRKAPYRLTMDTAFEEVIRACAEIPRPGQDGTWITDEMFDAYNHLFEMGLAHSVESWRGEELVGGLYGVSLGGAFFGESMFARADDASKIAFVHLIRQIDAWGIRLIDCQVYTDHLARFGAELWPRDRFLDALRDAMLQPTRQGRWSFDDAPEDDDT